MDYFYFDASALAKRYAPETGTDIVNQIFENTAPERLMCLTIGATEVVWILVRKRNDGRVSQNFFLQALLNLRDEVIDNPDFTTLIADDPTVIDSIGFIIQHSINSTDAIVSSPTTSSYGWLLHDETLPPRTTVHILNRLQAVRQSGVPRRK